MSDSSRSEAGKKPGTLLPGEPEFRDRSGLSLLELDDQGRISWLSRGLRSRLARTGSDGFGKPAVNFVHPDDREQVASCCSRPHSSSG